MSDHCAIKISLNLNLDRQATVKQGRQTYWKLNNAILKDEDFLPSFVSFWDSIKNTMDNYQDIAEWWDKFLH